jgi:hypothetical protein
LSEIVEYNEWMRLAGRRLAKIRKQEATISFLQSEVSQLREALREEVWVDDQCVVCGGVRWETDIPAGHAPGCRVEALLSSPKSK